MKVIPIPAFPIKYLASNEEGANKITKIALIALSGIAFTASLVVGSATLAVIAGVVLLASLVVSKYCFFLVPNGPKPTMEPSLLLQENFIRFYNWRIREFFKDNPSLFVDKISQHREFRFSENYLKLMSEQSQFDFFEMLELSVLFGSYLKRINFDLKQIDELIDKEKVCIKVQWGLMGNPYEILTTLIENRKVLEPMSDGFFKCFAKAPELLPVALQNFPGEKLVWLDGILSEMVPDKFNSKVLQTLQEKEGVLNGLQPRACAKLVSEMQGDGIDLVLDRVKRFDADQDLTYIIPFLSGVMNLSNEWKTKFVEIDSTIMDNWLCQLDKDSYPENFNHLCACLSKEQLEVALKHKCTRRLPFERDQIASLSNLPFPMFEKGLSFLDQLERPISRGSIIRNIKNIRLYFS